MKVHFTTVPAFSKLEAHSLVILVGEQGGALSMGTFAKSVDKQIDGLISAALKVNEKFSGARGEKLIVIAPKSFKASRVILYGVGSAKQLKDMNAHQAYHIGAQVAGLLSNTGEKGLTIVLDTHKDLPFTADIAAGIGAGAQLKFYRFDKYKTKASNEAKVTHKDIFIASSFSVDAKKIFARHNAVTAGMIVARDLGNEPPNVMFPVQAAKNAQNLKKLGVRVEVLDEKKLKELGFGSLLSVAKGSAQPPRVVVMQYKGQRNSTAAPIAFVGKGVTFDTGGINLKPFPNMWDMKFDMQGAAAVIGTMHALAARKAKVNAIGIVGFVENMPSDRSYRPGDILTSLSGQTIEVQNTDAEGRLILNDMLWYAQTRFKPRAVINLATLTGAIVAALGHEYAGMFSNNDELAKRLSEAGNATGDRVWRMPLDPAYDRQLASDYADMRNIGNTGESGAITAAQFLQRFIKKGQAWAHLDIAGVADSRDQALGSRGATGFGVRLLEQLVHAHYEGK